MHADLNHLRRNILRMSFGAGEGHIPSAFSVLDILWVLYDRILNVDSSHPLKGDRDRFVLSKGHASLGLYAVLAEKGFFPKEYLATFASFESSLGGHPDRNKVPGVECSTGSLGHGFPMAVGMAMGLRLCRSSARVYALVGDGEANEGTIWESTLLASHHGLANLCCIVDHNHSTDRALDLGDLCAKFSSFGWECRKVGGHDHEALVDVLVLPGTRPLAVIAETVKGRGCPSMENNPAWHHRVPTQAEFEELMRGLE